jgi:DNA-binding YbaB/EbfC family protein
MFGDMMGKLQDMKQKMDEIKKRLDTITVEGEAGNNAVKVRATGNRQIKSIEVNESLFKGDKEELEDLLVIAVNRALEKAEKVNEAEMAGAAKGIMPNLPGLF